MTPSSPTHTTAATANLPRSARQHARHPNRRQSLQWLTGMSAGSVLAACGGGSSGPEATADTLPEANRIHSQSRHIDLQMTARYADVPLRVARSPDSGPPAYPAAATAVNAHLRSFNGQQLAPTLVLHAGDTLRLKLVNALPANTRQSALGTLNHANSTNLHFHGLHVDPGEIRPGVYGDYVVDTHDAGIRPGESRQHELHIPPHHTPGIYWYHPHLHGSSTAQVASGMFGAILVRHPDDHFATDVRERVMFVHKPQVGKDQINQLIDTFGDFGDFLVNGALQPTLVLRPGEVQKWHFVNADTFYPFNPVLDDHTLHAFARDGNVFQGHFKPINTDTSALLDNAHWPGNHIYPGGRHSLLVQASTTSGTYYLRHRKEGTTSGRDEIVARIVVEGEPVPHTLPTPQQLPVFKAYAPITDEELARHGGRQRHLVLAALSTKADSPQAQRIAPTPAGEVWFPPEPELSAMTGMLFGTAELGSGSWQIAPFHSAITPTQTVDFDCVEEWTIHNPEGGYAHPFHIHVNDSCVVRVNGEPVTPHWADTLPVPPKGSITFRMRFEDFKGVFVWHCHALDHEDLGMMQLVHIA